MTRPTPKQRVLKKYPRAFCERWTLMCTVWPSPAVNRTLGVGTTAHAAWAAAARSLGRKR